MQYFLTFAAEGTSDMQLFYPLQIIKQRDGY